MITDVVAIATGTVKLLQPFLPYLEPFKTALQKKLTDATAGAAWDQAKGLWAKITGRFKDDKELHESAEAVAALPNNATLQKALTEVLAQRLKDAPDLTEELLQLLGGEKRLQEIVAGNEATIENIRQSMAGTGVQRVEAGDKAKISGVTMEQK